MPEILTAGDFGGAWYTRTEGGIRLGDGTGARIEHGRHPDPVVEGLRWQITEAGLIQAIGRLRALRRGPEAPAFLDIIGDVPLPISVDQVLPWEHAKPGAWAEMAGEGIVLGCVADIMACFPEAAPTRKAAREMCPPTLAPTPYMTSNKALGPTSRLAYKRLGRFAPAAALLLPNAPCDVQAWLSDRLGAIEWVRIEPVETGQASEARGAAWSAAAE